MKGIMWLLSGYGREAWLEKNLDVLLPFLKDRPYDKVFVVCNGGLKEFSDRIKYAIDEKGNP